MKMLINGQWVEASDGRRGEVHNPGTGETIDSVPLATVQDPKKHRGCSAGKQRCINSLPMSRQLSFSTCKMQSARIQARLCWLRKTASHHSDQGGSGCYSEYFQEFCGEQAHLRWWCRSAQCPGKTPFRMPSGNPGNSGRYRAV
jgi:hypothetical protein